MWTSKNRGRYDKRFGALQANDVKRLRQLEAENARLKKLVAERDLEIEVMKEVAAKNVWSAPSVQGSWTRHDDSCVNVSGLSRVGCCCSQAMMRSARAVSTKLVGQQEARFRRRIYGTPIDLRAPADRDQRFRLIATTHSD